MTQIYYILSFLIGVILLAPLFVIGLTGLAIDMLCQKAILWIVDVFWISVLAEDLKKKIKREPSDS